MSFEVSTLSARPLWHIWSVMSTRQFVNEAELGTESESCGSEVICSEALKSARPGFKSQPHVLVLGPWTNP